MSATSRLRQQGLALIVVIWLVAALSILVAGLTSLAKVDVRLTRLHLERAQMELLAESGVHLLMRDMQLARRAGDYSGRGPYTGAYAFGEYHIRLSALPVTGLINLNRANEDLLIALFQYGLDVDYDTALGLAHKVLDWRSEDALKRLHGADADDYRAAGLTHSPRNARFLVIEDLLQVLGITQAHFEKLQDMVSVLPTASFGVDPVSAPDEVLPILAEGNQAVVSALLSARQQPGLLESEARYAEYPLSFVSTSGTQNYRVDISLEKTSGAKYSRRLWVLTSASAQVRYGVPWIIAER